MEVVSNNDYKVRIVARKRAHIFSMFVDVGLTGRDTVNIARTFG